MAFDGWLIKFGTVEFPPRYIAPASYDVEPEKREIIDKFKNMDNLNHFDIYKNRKAVIELSTKMGLHQKDIEDIQKIIRAGLLNEIEGKYKVTFWNPCKSVYQDAEMRMEDIRYPMRKVDPKNKDIIYDSFTIKLTEY